jgi:hypothetical protein
MSDRSWPEPLYFGEVRNVLAGAGFDPVPDENGGYWGLCGVVFESAVAARNLIVVSCRHHHPIEDGLDVPNLELVESIAVISWSHEEVVLTGAKSAAAMRAILTQGTKETF